MRLSQIPPTLPVDTDRVPFSGQNDGDPPASVTPLLLAQALSGRDFGVADPNGNVVAEPGMFGKATDDQLWYKFENSDNTGWRKINIANAAGIFPGAPFDLADVGTTVLPVDQMGADVAGNFVTGDGSAIGGKMNGLGVNQRAFAFFDATLGSSASLRLSGGGCEFHFPSDRAGDLTARFIIEVELWTNHADSFGKVMWTIHPTVFDAAEECFALATTNTAGKKHIKSAVMASFFDLGGGQFSFTLNSTPPYNNLIEGYMIDASPAVTYGQVINAGTHALTDAAAFNLYPWFSTGFSAPPAAGYMYVKANITQVV